MSDYSSKTKPRKRTITLKPSTYQRSKAQLQEEIKLKIPGKDVNERARSLARAAL